ncbi:RidA family protein [Corynebacterium zhongnanshanii]|uniref:RidA family protein n=1 Tax=Corynebacterium zhongnanshanii TaxID=2768834 RepID=A0ABQ6VJH8_9CORY|nr:RidA family protein [Corynebacterium zhongnanshanii]KAB3522631.1 RidA family protein [Corynebacterium zhongnanshanii]
MAQTFSERLTELGIELPAVAAPVAAYVPAVKAGNTVYTSGQLPFVNGELPATGLVGDAEGKSTPDVTPEQAYDLARTAALNAVAAVDALVGIDNITQVVKVNGFVASARGFGGQPAVINGASEVLGEIFGDAGVHARAAVGVAELPLNAPVEVEIVVTVAE